LNSGREIEGLASWPLDDRDRQLEA
jgi:hypothetical protein